jgi:hypothetical protein
LTENFSGPKPHDMNINVLVITRVLAKELKKGGQKKDA